MAARSRSSIRFATSFAIANGFVGSRQASGGAATIFSSDDDARHERSSNVARKNLPVGRTYQRIRRSQTCQLILISVDPARELDQTAKRCSGGQSGQLPWSQEIRSSDSSVLARLSAARGPPTMPRELMATMQESGTTHHLSQSAVRFKRRKTKRPRSKVASAQKLSVQRQRAKCSELPQKNRAQLNCELTPGRFPDVANKGAQFRMERQGVGLLPLPEVGGDTCTECGTLTSVAHSAFECPAPHSPERGSSRHSMGFAQALG